MECFLLYLKQQIDASTVKIRLFHQKIESLP